VTHVEPGSEITLDLHGDLYSLAAVQEAATRFAPQAEIRIEPAGAYHRAIIRPRRAGSRDIVGREFANYALAATLALAPQQEPPGA
jgi:hypothetical protein